VSGPQGPYEPMLRAERPIDPNVRIGHVHLRTADIDRVRAFYVDLLGFDVIFEARDVPGWGTTGDILFVSAGGYHHHLGFNTWKSAGGAPQPDGVAGLHHVALLFSTRAQLAEAVGRLVDADVPLRQLTDHGTHLAVYLSDPDGNDLELAWDRPYDEWPRYGGDTPSADRPFDLDELLARSVVVAVLRLAREAGDGERLRARGEVRVHDEQELADACDRRRPLERRVGDRPVEPCARGAALQLQHADLRG
jgi:catechol 2,3-dioxygenase